MTDMTGGQLYKRLLKLLPDQRTTIALAVLGMAIHAGASALLAQLPSIIQVAFESTPSECDCQEVMPTSAPFWVEYFNLGPVVWLPLYLIFLFILRGMGSFLSIYFLQVLSSLTSHRLRSQLFGKMLTLPVNYYDKQSTGNVISRLTYNIEQISRATVNATLALVREGLTILGVLILLLLTNWQLTLLFLAVTPLAAGVVVLASGFFRRYSKRLQQSVGEVAQVANEVVPGIRVTKLFGRQAYEQQRFEKSSYKNYRQTVKIALTKGISDPVVQLLIATALAIITAVALIMEVPSGDYLIFITSALIIAKPVKSLTSVNQILQSGIAAASDVFAQMDVNDEQDDGAIKTFRGTGKVEVNALQFAYDAESPVLKGISFTALPGQTVALVGRSGSGKSTLTQLLPRFYQHYDGNIALDGVDTRTLSLAALRQQISFVDQNTVLFSGSIRDNIRYGRPDASEEEVQNAAEQAHVVEFANKLDLGLDTVLGDNGVTLSGGQRQRIAIARAIIKKAPILILDEATSALDTESERYIQETMAQLSGECTTIVIAHRLSTVENADQILVMDHGEVVERGNHQSLLSQQGYYAKLLSMQHHES